jgi:hypothetical protein
VKRSRKIYGAKYFATMAGRGRGRGRTVSFNVEALGINRGDALPGPILQPPPLFPVNEFSYPTPCHFLGILPLFQWGKKYFTFII